MCSKCETCQKLKCNKKKYGKLPPKQAEAVPWDTLYRDLIGPYKFFTKGGGKEYKLEAKKGNTLYLQAVSMIDPTKTCS